MFLGDKFCAQVVDRNIFLLSVDECFKYDPCARAKAIFQFDPG